MPPAGHGGLPGACSSSASEPPPSQRITMPKRAPSGRATAPRRGPPSTPRHTSSAVPRVRPCTCTMRWSAPPAAASQRERASSSRAVTAAANPASSNAAALRSLTATSSRRTPQRARQTMPNDPSRRGVSAVGESCSHGTWVGAGRGTARGDEAGGCGSAVRMESSAEPRALDDAVTVLNDAFDSASTTPAPGVRQSAHSASCSIRQPRGRERLPGHNNGCGPTRLKKRKMFA